MAIQETKDNRIRTLEQLKELAKGKDGLNCHILLGECVRSSKNIRYCPKGKRFVVLNLVDDSEQELTERQIIDKRYSNIGTAIEKGCLITD